MKSRSLTLLLSTWILLLGLIPCHTVAAPLGTAFNYNAHVSDQQGPVNGNHDVRFTLFTNELVTPPAAHGPITINDVQIKNGVLSASPDFGTGVFDGTLYWMAVDIRKQANDPWEPLGAPQPISAAPYAQYSPTSGKAKSVENGAVHSAGLQAKAVGRDKLDDKAVGNDQLDEDSISEMKMKDGAVSEGKLKDDAISEGKLKNGAVSRGKLALKAVGHDQLDEDSISEIKMKDAAVSEGKLKDAAVSEGKLKDDAISEGKLKNGAVSRDKLALKAVSNGQLDEDSVTAPKIASGHVVKSLNGLTDGVTLAAGNGIGITPGGNTLTLVSLPDPNVWKLNGNGVAATAFLGTTDGTALTLKVNNVVAMRYLPTTSVPNVVGGSEANSTGNANPEGITVGGGGGETSANLATDNFSTIGGGTDNQAGDNNASPSTAPYATVGGGLANRATAESATVAGGEDNRADGSRSVVGGGANNRSEADAATVAGGDSNVIEDGATGATIAGGQRNLISGAGAREGSTIGGGRFNTAGVSAFYATVPGGRSNFVDGFTSLAAGYRAKAMHNGAFVWADSGESDFESTDENEFAARALGGVRFVSGYSGAGNMAVGVQLAPGAGSWSSLSDRNTKTNLQPVEARSILERVARLPIATWNYKSQNASIRHIGPMAQDFASAFGVGESETTITTVDADGVALAAIQGLNQKLDEKDAEIQELKKTLAELKDLVGQLAGKQKGGAK